MMGYLHPRYTESLSEFGDPLELPASQGWLLKRAIRGVADAMGAYPLFVCADWTRLRDDLESMREPIVSMVVVTDPFGRYDEALLSKSFKDLVLPFKTHFARDLSKPLGNNISAHHARNTRLALKQLLVERCAEPASHLDEWFRLYSLLTERHQVRGIRAFSRRAFGLQLDTPGMVCFRALRGEETVGMTLWYEQNSVAYYHLGAYTNEGYALRASFALFHVALEHFAASGFEFASLGAGAGIGTAAEDGLSRFKQGWSNVTRKTFLCGRICNRREYESLMAATASARADYFPAYRAGEFN
jgi:hypothetical protein